MEEPEAKPIHLSQLIKALQEVQELRGDLEVAVFDGYGSFRLQSVGIEWPLRMDDTIFDHGERVVLCSKLHPDQMDEIVTIPELEE